MTSFRNFGHGSVLAIVAGLAVALAACGGGGTEFEQIGPGPVVGAVAPDFSAPDVNPASPTYNTMVSPRQRLGMISAWYFGHAT